jgi:hypothetical protein
LRAQIEALSLTTETGRTNTGTITDAIGNLPGNWAPRGDLPQLVQGSTSPVTFDDLDFTSQGGRNLTLYTFSTVDVTVSQCLMGEREFESGGFNFIQLRGDNNALRVEYTTLYGFDGAGGADNLLRRENDWNTGSMEVFRSRLVNLGGDGIKGSDCSIQECYVGPPKNLPAATLTYNSGTAYVVGDVVFGEGGDSERRYLKLTDGTGHALPSGTGSNTNWSWYDPHTDVFNTPTGDTYIGFTLVDMPANSDTFAGATNVDRSTRDEFSTSVMGVSLREGLVTQPWRGVYPIGYGRKDGWSQYKTFSDGENCQRGVRFFTSNINGNNNQDPLTNTTDWDESIYDGLEGPYVLRHSWIGAGINGDYFFPYSNTAGLAEASREPTPPVVVDNVVDYTTGLPIDLPNYCVVEDTPAPAFGVKGTYVPQAWSAEGNSWLVEATDEGQFHTEGGTTVDACVIQIGSSVIAYIESGQAPTLIPSAYHWTVTDEGAGVYRFHCLSLAGSRMTGRARVLAGTATITAETV